MKRFLRCESPLCVKMSIETDVSIFHSCPTTSLLHPIYLHLSKYISPGFYPQSHKSLTQLLLQVISFLSFLEGRVFKSISQPLGIFRDWWFSPVLNIHKTVILIWQCHHLSWYVWMPFQTYYKLVLDNCWSSINQKVPTSHPLWSNSTGCL